MLPNLSRLRTPTDATFFGLILREDDEKRRVPGLTYAELPDSLNEHRTRRKSDLYAAKGNGSCVAVVTTEELGGTPDLERAIGLRAKWLKIKIMKQGRFDASGANEANTALNRTELAELFVDVEAAEDVLANLPLGAPMHLYVDLASKEAAQRGVFGPFVYLGAYSRYETHEETYQLNVYYNGYNLANRVADAAVTTAKRGCALRALGEVAGQCGIDTQRHGWEALCDEGW